MFSLVDLCLFGGPYDELQATRMDVPAFRLAVILAFVI